jgi:hypothetical protein
MLGNVLLKLAPPARIVSAWNHDMARYDYYMVPKGIKLRPQAAPPGRAAFGEAVEVAIPRLPRAAVRVGTGTQARGTIVRRMTSSGTNGLGAVVSAIIDRMEA